MSSPGPPPTRPGAQPHDELLRLWQTGERPDVWDFLARTGPPTLEVIVAALAVDQQERWQRGEQPWAEAYLERCPELCGRPEAALELIYGEFLLRERRGESPRPEEYLRRFPAFAPRLDEQFQLHEALGTPSCQARPVESVREGLETTDDVVRVTVGEEPAPIGQIGRFRLRALLGQGGFGRVYRAHDPQLDRQVALKVPRFASDRAEDVERFLGEARAAARLRHPNLVAVFESGRAGDDYYIVSEFVEGLPLSERLLRDPPDFRRAAEWVRDLARALAYAHAEGVIHRDIKSANVLIDRDGRPQLTDFGLAKRLGEDATRTADGAVMGTPAYMAPEQARGDTKAVGPPSDQYSLGVVLYELLARRLPFDAPPHVLLLQVIADEPPPPSRFNPALPRDLEAVCLKAMAKQPARRYATAAEFADDLDRWLAGAPVRARRPGWRERAGRWLRRRRHAVFAAAGVLLAVALTLGAVWWAGGFRFAPSAGETQSMISRAGQLKTIGVALQAYHAQTGFLPQPAIYKDGKPMLSWRVAILPSLDENELYRRFNLQEPWDGPNNKKLLEFMPKVYEAAGAKPPRPYMTYYQAVVGPGAVFDPDPQRRIRLMEVTDSRDTTMCLAEAAVPVDWTRPDDLVVASERPLPRFGGLSADGFNAGFADGHVQFLKQDICKDDGLMRRLVLRAGKGLVQLRPYEVDPAAAPPKAAAPKDDAPKDAPKAAADPEAAARDVGRKTASKNNLNQLSLALHHYLDANNTLPPSAVCAPDGKPLLSWRVAILPFVGRKDLYDRFRRDEPWDGPHNRELLQYIPKEFVIPDLPTADPTTTYYQLFVGPGAYEPGTKRRTILAIPDGASHTIAIAEGGEAVPWTAPVDLAYAPDAPLPKLGGPFTDGFHAVPFAGPPQFFKKEIYADERALRALIGWSDGQVVDLRPYREAPPRYPAGSIGLAAATAGRRMASANHLKQLGLALHNYHDAMSTFPPYAVPGKDGKPLLSWRVALLPFLDENLLYKKFKLDEPWDGPHNRELLPLMPQVFEAPGVDTTPDRTFYQVFVGPGAAFNPDPTRRVRQASLRGGAGSTLAVVEGGAPVPWTKPDDLFFEAGKPLPRLGGVFPEGFQACMFDGSVHFIGAKIYEDEMALRALIDVNGDKKINLDSYR